LFTTDNEFYTVTSREQRYIFESDTEIRFFYDSSSTIYDSRSNSIIKDSIKVLSVNSDPASANGTLPFTIDQAWEIVSEYSGLDGYVDNKKIVVTFADSDNNGVVDNPELFNNIVMPDSSDWKKYILQEKYTISQGQDDYRYVANPNNSIVTIVATKNLATNITPGRYYYIIDTDTVVKANAINALIPTLDYKVFQGRDALKFQYQHSADYNSRIDPSPSNIIDVFVLTKGYDTLFRQWVDGAPINKPLPPSSAELYDVISPNLNLIKTISDEVIYHPISYKILFGTIADADLQASFKIVKNSSQVVSDNDIKVRAITAINQFFALDNWDFGDTFYFTELATYVTTQLSPDISNFVIVPRQTGLNFGSLFEIKAASDQLFINGATVNDIEIIPSITPSLIKSITGTPATAVNLTQQNVTSSKYGATNG
jgi:hypothetical protein